VQNPVQTYEAANDAIALPPLQVPNGLVRPVTGRHLLSKKLHKQKQNLNSCVDLASFNVSDDRITKSPNVLGFVEAYHKNQSIAASITLPLKMIL
jgi:hypothetical protein